MIFQIVFSRPDLYCRDFPCWEEFWPSGFLSFHDLKGFYQALWRGGLANKVFEFI